MSPTPELDLVQVDEAGACTICGVRQTTTWCKSCAPQHYICPGCCESHKASRQDQAGAAAE